MPNQKKIQKKKDRDKEVRQKMVRRRAAIRAARKAESEKEDAMEREYFQRRNDPTLTPEKKKELLTNMSKKAAKNLTEDESKERDEAIVAKLRNNIAMLEKLEKEYLEEQESREKTNSVLEGQGASTIKEKLDLLKEMQKKAIEENAQIEILTD